MTGEKVGETISTHSFVDGNDEFVKGATIDLGSKEGQEFVDYLVELDPPIDVYMFNARNGKAFDFKDLGIDERGIYVTEDQHRYRGSVMNNGLIGSARDFGNIGAGLVARRFGLSWEGARFGFDLYQSRWAIFRFEWEEEGVPTQLAQRYGFQLALDLGLATDLKFEAPAYSPSPTFYRFGE